MKQYSLIFVLVIMLFFYSGCSGKSSGGDALRGIESISTNNPANHNVDFYYYIPSVVRNNPEKSHPVLLCIPNSSRRGEDYAGTLFKMFADKEGFILLAPTFIFEPSDFTEKRSYNFPRAWSGKAITDMIDLLKKKHNLNLAKLYIHGNLEGAEAAVRFSLLKPDLIAAVSAHSINDIIFPREKNDVKYLITTDTVNEDKLQNAQNFFVHAKRQGIDVEFKRMGGVNELPREQITESLELFKKVNAAHK